MCCDDPNVSKATNGAKCASVGALVTGLICLLLGMLTLAVGGVTAFLGGLLATISSSMLICCGPKVKGQGMSVHKAGMVLFMLSAIIMGASMSVLISALCAAEEEHRATPQSPPPHSLTLSPPGSAGASASAASSDCATHDPTVPTDMAKLTNDLCGATKGAFVGLIAAITWPAIIMFAASLAMDIWAAVACSRAMKEIGIEISNLNRGAHAMGEISVVTVGSVVSSTSVYPPPDPLPKAMP